MVDGAVNDGHLLCVEHNAAARHCTEVSPDYVPAVPCLHARQPLDCGVKHGGPVAFPTKLFDLINGGVDGHEVPLSFKFDGTHLGVLQGEVLHAVLHSAHLRIVDAEPSTALVEPLCDERT